MIVLGLVDYVLILAIFGVVLLKIMADIRDIQGARAARKGLKLTAKRKFFPKTTILIQLESLEPMKDTLEHLTELDLPLSVFVVVDSEKDPKAARALRYFISKKALKGVKVVSKKQPNLMNIAAKNAKSGLVAVLPESVRINKTFYKDNILPFGDSKVDAVRLMSVVRPGKTIISGIEVLFTQWRAYLHFDKNASLCGLDETTLSEGVLLRAKYSRKLPKKSFAVINARKSAYSVAPQDSVSATYEKLRQSLSAVDVIGIAALTATAIFLFQQTTSISLAAGVFTFLFGVLVWWSLGAAQMSLMNRISILFLSPALFVSTWLLIISQGIRVVAARR